jgi:hypothetical protein
MARNLTAALNTEFTSDSFTVVFFFKSVWNSGTSYLWTGYEDISWDGQTWLGTGNLAGVSSIEETQEIIASGATFTLSGVPSALLALALGDARQGNEVSMWVGALDSAGAIVVDPYKVFSGLMDVPGIQENGENSVITLQAENRLIELDRPREVRYTDRYQQGRFASDVGMEYIAGLQDKSIHWGQPG